MYHNIVYTEKCHDIVYKLHNSTHIAMVINDRIQPPFIAMVARLSFTDKYPLNPTFLTHLSANGAPTL